MERKGNTQTLESQPSLAHPLVCVVLLSYNNWQHTEFCLNSLSALNYPNYRVLIVDNGSRDACPPQIRTRFPTVDILLNSCNLGYAAGCNRGMRRAREHDPDYIWLLNNDTEVEPDSLTAMVSLCETDHKLGAVGSVLLNPDSMRSIQACGGGRISFLTGLPSHILDKSERRVDYICGASLLLRSTALDQVGLLDTGFFLYWEDTDICFRLRARGWKLAVATESRVVHKGSSSAIFQSVFYDYHFTASSVRFFRLHTRFWVLPLSVSVAGRMARRALSGRAENVRAVWRGLRDALNNDLRVRFST